jgi:hypothetical protein
VSNTLLTDGFVFKNLLQGHFLKFFFSPLHITLEEIGIIEANDRLLTLKFE